MATHADIRQFEAAYDMAGSEVAPSVEPWEPPTILTAAEVCALEPPPGTPLLGSVDSPLVMPGWRVVIGGQSGAGKTTMALHLIRAVTESGEFLGWKGTGGRALVLDLEQGLRTVQRRLEEVGLDESEAVDYVRIPDGLSLERSEVQRQWLEELLRGGRYVVVLIDPLYKMHQGDPNDERSIVDLLRQIDGLRDELGFAVLIPAHLRKADTKGGRSLGMDDISGSGALVRGAEVVVGIQLLSGIPEGNPEGHGRSRLHWWKDRDGDLPVGAKWDLLFRPDEGFRRDEAQGKRARVEDAIVEVLARVFPAMLGLDELADQTGRSERTVERGIATLRKEGVELKEARGKGSRKIYGLETVVDPELEGWE